MFQAFFGSASPFEAFFGGGGGRGGQGGGATYTFVSKDGQSEVTRTSGWTARAASGDDGRSEAPRDLDVDGYISAQTVTGRWVGGQAKEFETSTRHRKGQAVSQADRPAGRIG